MKQSLYNIRSRNEAGELLLANELYHSYVKVDEPRAEKIVRILDGKQESDDAELMEWMYQKGFLVDSGKEEKKYVDYLCNDLIYGDTTLHLTLIPTDDCNFRCRYCYEDKEHHTMGDDVVENIKKMLKLSTKKHGAIFLSWYGGEPLMASDIVLDIMTYAQKVCAENHVPLYGQMTTNGYLLNVDLFRKLQRAHILSYMVSLDGTKETHNYQRPHVKDPDSFERILTNLKEIRDTVPNRNFRIGIRVNVSPRMLGVLKEYVDLIGKEFGEDNRFGVIWEWVKDWGGRTICGNKDLVSSHETSEYNRYMDILTEKGVLLDRGQAYSRIGNEMCIASRKNGYTINYDGEIYKCAMVMDATGISENHVGTLLESGELKIDTYRNSLWVGQADIPKKCGSCGHYPECCGLLCPFSTKIRKNFHCPENIRKEEMYMMRNLQLLHVYEELPDL